MQLMPPSTHTHLPPVPALALCPALTPALPLCPALTPVMPLCPALTPPCLTFALPRQLSIRAQE